MDKRIAIVSVYTNDNATFEMYARILLEILGERKPEENISHKVMPTLVQHMDFVKSKPYKQWYIIQDLDTKAFVGCCYLGKEDNIGISIYEKYRRQGYARDAIKTLMDYNPQPRFYANINPYNHKSKALFESLGFDYAYDEFVGGKKVQEVWMLNRGDASE